MATAPKPRRAALGVCALILAASLFAIWWVFVYPPMPATGPAPTPPPINLSIAAPTRLSKSAFYERDLLPMLEKAKKQNNVDADQAADRLHEDFDRFRAGVPRFADDLSSWGTRFGVLSRMTKDGWRNSWKSKTDPDSDEVKNYTLDKFETHIMSRSALQKSVDTAFGQFRDDVTASRNLLLREMKLALTTSDMQVDFPMPDFEDFQHDFDAFVATSVERQATESVENALITFIASMAGSAAAEQVLVQMIRILTINVLVAGTEAAAAGGSSMASGGALGAAAGWLGGPAGEVIGVGVGLAIGVIIDWWLTDRFKANLTQELTGYLNTLESEMIDGVTEKKGRPAQPGMRELLHKAANGIHTIQCSAVLKALGEVQ